MAVAALVAASVFVGILTGASVGLASSGVRGGTGVARMGAGVAVLGALSVVAFAIVLGTAGLVGASWLPGVGSADGAACGAVVGRAVGVGVLIAGVIGAAGARIAT